MILPMTLMAQDSRWQFDTIFPPDEDNVIHATNFGVHGIAVDLNDRVWVTSYYNRTVIDETGMAAIRVYEEDGTEASFSPIWTITVGEVTDTLVYATTPANANSATGIGLDNEGNIIYTTRTTVYRIDADTGEGIERFQWDQPTFTGPATADGLVTLTTITGGPIQLFDTSFNPVIVVDPLAAGVRRSIAMSEDTEHIFVPIIGDAGGFTRHYTGDELSGYTQQDSIALGLHGASATVQPGTTLLWLSSGDETGSDNIVNTVAGDTIDTDYMPHTWYAYNYETGQIEDYIQWEGETAIPPRAIAFSQDGTTAYIGNFSSGNGLPGVQRFQLVDTSIEPVEGLPSAFELKQNYPNPFNPSTKIEFAIMEAGDVTLKVYDVLGREVAVLQDGPLAAGNYSANFDASNLASGTYIYMLEAGGQRVSKSMVLLK